MSIVKFNGGDAVTMTSLELVDFINNHRKGQAEQVGQSFPSDDFSILRHDHFMDKVPKVIGLEGLPKFRDTYYHPQNGQGYQCFRFPKRESCLMAMSYSYDLQAAVFDYMTELEQRLAKPMSQAQLIAASANLMVDMERRQVHTEQAVAVIETRVAQVEHTRYFESVPAGFESITGLRSRIGLRHGVPAWVVNEVMRALPYCPKPFGFVKSKHADDGGKPYPVYPVADITRLFDRFVSECTFETEQFATHPDIQQGRFKLCRRKTL